MLRLKPRQRVELSETLRDLANLAAGALVLAQFVGDQQPSWRLIAGGVAVWVVLVAFSLSLDGEA